MLFMVVKRFKDGKAKEIYPRFQEKGRMNPQCPMPHAPCPMPHTYRRLVSFVTNFQPSAWSTSFIESSWRLLKADALSRK